jgi:hypothetical protein
MESVGMRKTLIPTISENMSDLMVPFRQGSIYHWQMMGSYSQKAVLPVLVPDLCYDGMEVANGCQDTAELNKIRQNLLEYCKMDTLGMAKIVERLRVVVKAIR